MSDDPYEALRRMFMEDQIAAMQRYGGVDPTMAHSNPYARMCPHCGEPRNVTTQLQPCSACGAPVI